VNEFAIAISAAEHALARVRLSGEDESGIATLEKDWIVARVCSEYLQYCERSARLAP
jgi:hypothetical protein